MHVISLIFILLQRGICYRNVGGELQVIYTKQSIKYEIKSSETEYTRFHYRNSEPITFTSIYPSVHEHAIPFVLNNQQEEGGVQRQNYLKYQYHTAWKAQKFSTLMSR
ncbi:unnamed protein product, partial [Heterobilharzia americana]